MPLVVFESSDGTAARAIAAAAGGRLVDLCDESGAPIPLSCRGATCGTCRIEVIEGADLLQTAGGEEVAVLAALGDEAPRRRLACQACVCAGAGLLRVRAVEPHHVVGAEPPGGT